MIRFAKNNRSIFIDFDTRIFPLFFIIYNQLIYNINYRFKIYSMFAQILIKKTILGCVLNIYFVNFTKMLILIFLSK